MRRGTARKLNIAEATPPEEGEAGRVVQRTTGRGLHLRAETPVAEAVGHAGQWDNKKGRGRTSPAHGRATSSLESLRG